MWRCNSPHSQFKKRGFTLIELLIVLAILGVLGSLVGPAGFAQYQRAMALQERQELRSTIQQAQLHAFRTRSTLELHMQGTQLDILHNDSVHSRVQFERIEFDTLRLHVNSHGVWSQDLLVWREVGIERELQLNPPALSDQVAETSSLEFAR